MVFIEAFFWRCIEAGQKDGSIAATRPADELAKSLLSVLLGIRVLARTRPHVTCSKAPPTGCWRCRQAKSILD